MDDLFRVGVIKETHGIRGEVKVFPTTDDMHRFSDLKEVLLIHQKKQMKMELESVRFFKNLVIIKFKGISDINGVEPFVKDELFVTRENAIPLGENEYYISDLIGLHVVTDYWLSLGNISDVLITGANDVYVVRNDNCENEILIPAIKQCILDVSLVKGEMLVHLLDGMLNE